MTPELKPNNVAENKFYQSVRMWLNSFDVHMQRIETTTGPGVPDLNICYSGWDVWVELKCETKYGVLLRPEQNVWMMRRTKVGGKACVLAKMNNGDINIWHYRDGLSISFNLISGKYLQISSKPNRTIGAKSKNIPSLLLTNLFTIEPT